MPDNTHKTRFIMIGGFLGAGKTTTLARLAKYYIEQGNKVGLVTNDQAFGLVDTMSLRAQGFDVGEVPGACFCCKFDELVDTIVRLDEQTHPDVVIVEPVGSCTDLVATVIEPLRHFHGDRYSISPIVALVKPEHGLKILRDGAGFSPKAAYIFLKQIEEADIAVVNKVDKLSATDRNDLEELLKQRFPEKTLIAMSARDGQGFDALVQLLDTDLRKSTQVMDVDYDIYAEGEAELGWLNCKAEVESPHFHSFSLDDFVLQLSRHIAKELDDEPAHIKILAQSEQDFAIANLVDSTTEVELPIGSECKTNHAEILINARVAGDPEQLADIAQQALDFVATSFNLDVKLGDLQYFRPARPTPTHRISP